MSSIAAQPLALPKLVTAAAEMRDEASHRYAIACERGDMRGAAEATDDLKAAARRWSRAVRDVEAMRARNNPRADRRRATVRT